MAPMDGPALSFVTCPCRPAAICAMAVAFLVESYPDRRSHQLVAARHGAAARLEPEEPGRVAVQVLFHHRVADRQRQRVFDDGGHGREGEGGAEDELVG